MAEPVTTEDLKRYAVPRQARVDDAFVRSCLDESVALVEQQIGKAVAVPDVIRRRAVLEVGSNLVRRRTGLDTAAQFEGDYTGSGLDTLRVTRDPIQACRAILAPWLGVGIA